MSTRNLRVVRAAPDPLGLYIRAGRVDQRALQSFVTSRPLAFTGVVFEARRVVDQRELLALVLDRGLDAVLDPQTQAMATIGGYTPRMGGLPWSPKRAHRLDDLATKFQQRQMVDEVADFAVRHGFTQVLAPTHRLSGPRDPWLAIDIALTNMLQSVLRNLGAGHIQVHYSLALSYETFRTTPKRAAILNTLRGGSFDGLWLNVDGTGSDSSPTAITRYCDAASDFQALGVPLVADHAGGLMGLSLLAFGGVGGLSHGITIGERFNTNNWNRKPVGKPFGQKTRIYIPQIDLLLGRVDAERLFEAGGNRARSAFGCRDTNCCHRGIDDMLQAPARHFLYQRAQQVGGLGRVPESLRPTQFLEEHVRPASDAALLATKLALPADLQAKAARQAKRLNDLRTTLGPYARKRRDASFALHPMTRIRRAG